MASEKNKKNADTLAVIGMGVSNTTVAAQMLEDMATISALAESEGLDVPRKTIYLIDRDMNHGNGKAWGVHTHPSMLWIYPVERSGDGFCEWLRDNESKWLPEVEQYKDTLLETWFRTNEYPLSKKDYGSIHMPRYIYGMFKQDTLLTALEHVPPCVDVKILNGEVIDSKERPEGGARLSFKEPPELLEFVRDEHGKPAIRPTGQFFNGTQIDSDIQLVGIGSPPSTPFPAVRNHPDYFADTLARNPNRPGTGFPDQFKQAVLEKHEKTGEKVRVGILGASHACLDIINMVHSDRQLRNAVELSTVSRVGRIRHNAETLTAIQNMDVTELAGNIKDVVPSHDNSGIKVELAGSHDVSFDMVVQTLGFGKWQDVGMLREGFEKKHYEEIPWESGLMWLNVPPSMQMGGGSYANGFLAFAQLTGTAKQAFLPAVESLKERYSGLLLPELMGDVIDELGRKLGGTQCHPPSLERFCAPEGKDRAL